MSYEVKVRFVLDRECRFFRHSRPFKRKIKFWQIANVNDDPNLIRAIDKALKIEDKKPEEIDKNDPIINQWLKIKGDPKLSLYCFHFKRGFRHPMLKGKEIYAYTFFDLTDMIKRVGSHNEMHGFFLDEPLSYYTPPSKEQWIMRELQKLRDRGEIKTAEDVKRYVKALSKQYRRAVEKRKFINLLWIPTWTRQGYMQILQQTRKVQEYAKILHHAEAKISPKLAMTDYLEKAYESMKQQIEDHIELHRKSASIISKQAIEIEEKERLLSELKRPVMYHPAGRPSIMYQPPPPVTGRITQAFKGIEPSTWITFMLAIGALACMILGINQYMLDPSRWGLMILGFLLLACAIVVYIFKMRTRVPVEIKERAETVAEEVTE